MRRGASFGAWVLAASLFLGGFPSPAGGTTEDPPEVWFSITPAVSDAAVVVSLGFRSGNVQGWSIGLCHDPSSARVARFLATPELASVREGGLPEFYLCEQGSAESGRAGIIQAAVLSLRDPFYLPLADGDFPILEVEYDVVAESTIDVCSGLEGSGKPVSVAVTVSGTTRAPAQPAVAQIIQKPYARKLAYQVDPAQSSEVVTVSLTSEEVPVQGWSFALCSSALAAEVVEFATAPAVEEILGGEPPAFLRNEVTPLDPFIAVRQTVLLGTPIAPASAGPFPAGLPVLGIRYRVLEENDIKFCDGASGVTFDNRVIVDRIGYVPARRTGARLVTGSLGSRFIRGDADLNGLLEMTDPVYVLGSLFLGYGDLPCLDAADANDVGPVDISDPIFTLRYLFLGGPPPPSPYPEPGEDLSPPTALGCERGI